jgi:hypothetical protein
MKPLSRQINDATETSQQIIALFHIFVVHYFCHHAERTTMSTLAEELPAELERCRELRDEYKLISTGGFGVMVIDRAIKQAEKSMAEQDVAAMIRALKELKGIS